MYFDFDADLNKYGYLLVAFASLLGFESKKRVRTLIAAW